MKRNLKYIIYFIVFNSFFCLAQVRLENYCSSNKTGWICLLSNEDGVVQTVSSNCNFEPLIMGEKVYTMSYEQHRHLSIRKMYINEMVIVNNKFKFQNKYLVTLSSINIELKAERAINTSSFERIGNYFIFIYKYGLFKRKIKIELTENNITNFNKIFQEQIKKQLKKSSLKFSFDDKAWR